MPRRNRNARGGTGRRAQVGKVPAAVSASWRGPMAHQLPKCKRTGKAMFPTALDAQRALARSRRRRDTQQGAPAVRAYPCPVCGAWHLTKAPRTGRK